MASNCFYTAEAVLISCILIREDSIDTICLSQEGQFMHQVCWDMNDQDTITRELRALHDAEKELNIKGELITPESFLDKFEF